MWWSSAQAKPPDHDRSLRHRLLHAVEWNTVMDELVQDRQVAPKRKPEWSKSFVHGAITGSLLVFFLMMRMLELGLETLCTGL